MRLPKINPWLLAGLGGAIALAFTQRRTIMIYGAKALESGKELLFQTSLSSEAQPYSSLILQVARETGIDPFLIYALGQRESRWGAALSPPGPAGTGDNGHGRGLMQIDDRQHGDSDFRAWLAANDWTDPYTNVKQGALVLKSKIDFFSSRSPLTRLTDGFLVTDGRILHLSPSKAAARGVGAGDYADPRPLQGDALNRAAIAAYNTGSENVLISLALGEDVESTTAGSNYLSWVWDRMAEAANAFGVA